MANNEDSATLEEMTFVMNAFKEGKEIQMKSRPQFGYDEWSDCKHPLWNWSDWMYRIKPEKPIRPYASKLEFLKASKEHGPHIFIKKEKHDGNSTTESSKCILPCYCDDEMFVWVEPDSAYYSENMLMNKFTCCARYSHVFQMDSFTWEDGTKLYMPKTDE